MSDFERPLAELIVGFGANVQPGQIVAITSEPGKEALARVIAEACYEAGALFVDQAVFDVYLKRARLRHANPDTLGFVPEWYGQRVLALADRRSAWIGLSGPVAPRALDGIDPALIGLDMLPRLPESNRFVNERTINWTAAPCPTSAWAELVYPELDPDRALRRLWDEIAHVCRLDAPDPIAAWQARIDRLRAVSSALDELALDSVRFEGPGTSLTVGLLRSSRWRGAAFETVDGIRHLSNLPSEEVFTTPDPERTEGHVTSTKPLFVAGTTIAGLRVRFEGGRAVAIDADQGAGALRSLADRDAGAARLGEVALVDRESRIGDLETVFYDTLLDENAASHIALGNGFEFAVDSDDDRARINHSAIHVDFMIGSNEVDVTGVRADGGEVPLLRDGSWQV